jgi:hypothetical protein
MKSLLVVLIFAAGTVESVREVPLDIHGFREAIEHSVNPQTVQQLVIRLDDERAVTLVEEGMQRFAPGERVRIVSGLVERE